MTLLSKEQILQATDVDVGEIEVPEWGGRVRVIAPNALYMQRLIQSGFINPQTNQVDMSKIDFIDLAARSLVDDNNEPLLTRKEAQALARKSWSALAAIATKAMELSGFSSDEDEDDAKNE